MRTWTWGSASSTDGCAAAHRTRPGGGPVSRNAVRSGRGTGQRAPAGLVRWPAAAAAAGRLRLRRPLGPRILNARPLGRLSAATRRRRRAAGTRPGWRRAVGRPPAQRAGACRVQEAACVLLRSRERRGRGPVGARRPSSRRRPTALPPDAFPHPPPPVPRPPLSVSEGTAPRGPRRRSPPQHPSRGQRRRPPGRGHDPADPRRWADGRTSPGRPGRPVADRAVAAGGGRRLWEAATRGRHRLRRGRALARAAGGARRRAMAGQPSSIIASANGLQGVWNG